MLVLHELKWIKAKEKVKEIASLFQENRLKPKEIFRLAMYERTNKKNFDKIGIL